MVPHPPIILPNIGRGEEKKIQDIADACQHAADAIVASQPDTILIVSPHAPSYFDYIQISDGPSGRGSMAQFRDPMDTFEIPYDRELIRETARICEEAGIPAGTLGQQDGSLDHGTMVPLYFVNQYWNAYRLVRIGLSGLPLSQHMALGRLIQDTVRALGRSAVIIASGDLSHRLKADGPYGYQKEGPAYDTRVMDVMGRAAFGELLSFSEDFCSRAGECGHRSFTMMAGALEAEAGASKERPGKEIAAARLSYEGPFGVGYGVCMYEIKEKAPADGR